MRTAAPRPMTGRPRCICSKRTITSPSPKRSTSPEDSSTLVGSTLRADDTGDEAEAELATSDTKTADAPPTKNLRMTSSKRPSRESPLTKAARLWHRSWKVQVDEDRPCAECAETRTKYRKLFSC